MQLACLRSALRSGWIRTSRRLCLAATADPYAPLPEFPPQPALRPFLPYNILSKRRFQVPSTLMNASFLTEDDKQKDSVGFKLRNGILLCQLCSKDADSRLTWPMSRLLTRALTEAADSNEVKGVILTGTGGVFCGGSVVVDPSSVEGGKKEIIETTCELLEELVAAVINLPKPIMLAVNGKCSGFLFKMFPLFDRVVAMEGCELFCGGGAMSKHNVCCSSVSSWKKNELKLLGRLSAEEAQAINLVHRTEPIESLFRATLEDMDVAVAKLAGAETKKNRKKLLEANKREIHKLTKKLLTTVT